MIRDLTRCSEQTENKAMKQTNLRTHRTVARELLFVVRKTG